MKKYFAISMLIIFLFSATDFRELLKTGILVKHFYETREVDKTVSIFKFLFWHYVTDDLNNMDNDRDTQLPFKSTCAGTESNFQMLSANQFMTVTFQLFVVKEGKYLYERNPVIISKHSLMVWHPPQFS